MNFTTKSRYAVNALADLEYLSHHETPVSLKNIMDAVEENLDATNCSGTSSCHAGQQCNSHKLWDDLNSVVDEFLSDISITDLVEKPRDPHIPLKEIKS